MSFLIYLDNTELDPNSDYSNVDGSEINLRRKDENGETVFSFASEVQFYGIAYEKIKSKLIEDPNALNNSIAVKIVDDCCGGVTVFEGEIRADTIDWCDFECFITATIIEKSAKTAATNCLASTLIYDNRKGFQQQQHPFVRHCVEYRPDLIAEFLLIFVLILNIIFFILTPLAFVVEIIVDIINAIIDFANTLGAGLDNITFGGDGHFITWYFNFRQRMNNSIIGCGFGHPAPLLRDYLSNVCEICGLTFKSSILTDPASVYYDTLLFSAPITKGTQDYKTFSDDDKPTYTGETLLDALKKTFNADYRIENGILTFERRDFFMSSTVLIDATTLSRDEIVRLCFKYSTKQQAAFAQFEYALDAMDTVGNEAKSLYDDIVDWNTPFGSYPNLKGRREVNIPFGRSRYRQDALDRDVLTDWQNMFLIGSILFEEEHKHLLLLNMEVAFTAKLLIWDGSSDYKNAQILKRPKPGDRWEYNYYYFVDQFFNVPEMYQRFWHIEDPRNNYRLGRDYTLEVVKSCDLLVSLSLDKVVLLKQIVAGVPQVQSGTIETISVQEDTIIIQGKI